MSILLVVIALFATVALAVAAMQAAAMAAPRGIAAQFAPHTDLRRVATMPGAPKILES